MRHSELAIAGFYDHEEQTERRAPDWGGDDLFTSIAPRRRFDRPAHPARLRETTEHPLPARHAAEPAAPAVREAEAEDRYLEPVPEGRRTVTITGRAGGSYHAVARRPARSIDERIAHRPERIASWACAMGVLLILLAVITSH